MPVINRETTTEAPPPTDKKTNQNNVEVEEVCPHAHLSKDGVYCYDCRRVVSFSPHPKGKPKG